MKLAVYFLFSCFALELMKTEEILEDSGSGDVSVADNGVKTDQSLSSEELLVYSERVTIEGLTEQTDPTSVTPATVPGHSNQEVNDGEGISTSSALGKETKPTSFSPKTHKTQGHGNQTVNGTTGIFDSNNVSKIGTKDVITVGTKSAMKTSQSQSTKRMLSDGEVRTTSLITSMENRCSNVTCENGGNCTLDKDDQPKCSCSSDFIGPSCSIKKLSVPKCTDKLFSKISSTSASIDLSAIQFSDTTSHIKVILFPIYTQITQSYTSRRFQLTQEKPTFHRLFPGTVYNVSVISLLKINNTTYKSEQGCQKNELWTKPVDINCSDVYIANITTNNITVNLPSVNQSDGITHFRVSIKTNAKKNKKMFHPAENKTTTLTILSLLPATLYNITVKGVSRIMNKTQGSHACNVFSNYTYPLLNCSLLTVEDDAGRISILMTNTTAPKTSQLRLEVSSGNFSETKYIKTIPDGNYSITEQRGRTYNINVAVQGGGELWSQTLCRRTVAIKPTTPKCQNVSSIPFNTSIIIDVKALNSEDASHYRIEKMESKMEYTTQNKMNVVFHGLSPGKQYKFQIFAVGFNGLKSDGSCTYIASTRPNTPVCVQSMFEKITTKKMVLNTAVLKATGSTKYRIKIKDVSRGNFEEHVSTGKLTVENLQPGSNYTFNISSLSFYNTESNSGCFIWKYTYPARPEQIYLQNATGGNIKMLWNATNRRVDSYHVNASCNCATNCDVKLFNVTSPPVQIRGMSLASSCIFTVYAIAGGLKSEPRTITTKQEAPDEVSKLTVENITDDESFVYWSTPIHPNSKSLLYIIKLTDAEGSEHSLFEVAKNTSNRNLNTRLDNLNPGTCYTVTVTAMNDAGEGPPVSTSFYSAESVPQMVTNFSTLSSTSSSVSVSWQEPTVKDGVIMNYTVIVTQISYDNCMRSPPPVCTTEISLYCEECKRDCQDAVSSMDAIEKATITANCRESITYPFYRMNGTFNIEIEDLKPYTKYKLGVFASNSAGNGNVSESIFRTKEAVSTPITQLTIENVTSNTVTLSFAGPNCTNGIIRSFLVEYSYRDRNNNYCFQNASRAKEINQNLLVNYTSVDKDGYRFILPVHGLFSYWSYVFQVAAINHAGKSKPTSYFGIRTHPAIPDPVDIFFVASRDPYFVKVVWREPCFPNGIIKKYILTTIYKEGNISSNISGNFTSWTIRKLLPDRSYRFQIVAVNDAGHGNITELNTRTPTTVPYKPRLLNAYSLNATAINVTWSPPNLRTGRTHYIASATDNDTNQVILKCKVLGFTAGWCIISGLDEYWSYTIAVTAHTVNGSNSSEFSSLVKTKEAAPGKIRNLQIYSPRDAAAPRQVNVTWKSPRERDKNGMIRGYILKYWMKENDEDKKIKEISSGTAVYNLDLTPEKEYIFQVQAKTITVGSFSEDKSVVVQAGAPPLHLISSSQPMIQAGPNSLVADEEQQFSITLNVLTLCDRTYGSPSSWGIIVAESSQAKDEAYRGSRNIFDVLKYKKYRTWSTVRNSDIIAPYIASDKWKPPCVSGRTKRAVIPRSVTTSFLIGADGECEGSRKVCNGFLKPAKEYRVRVWVCTNGGCSESPYSEVIRTEKSQLPSIVGSIVGVIVFLVAVCIVVLILRKKGIRLFKEKEEIDDDVFIESKGMEMKRKTGPTPIKLDTFADHVQSMHQDSNLCFSKEYKMIKDTCPQHSTIAAEAQASRIKNRYTNILPYDHSRVKLLPMDDEEGSDYINANYMPGYNSKREYIATQGPLTCTKDDFWRMIWEQNVSIIVMVTQIIERGRRKCECYWPETVKEPVYFGDLIVELESDSTLPDYIIRIISIKVGNKKRKIKQLHFLKWPDMGCPETTWLLLNFAQSVRLYVPHVNPGPIVVHCSAGVGRTGTFIAVDHLMQHVRQNTSVDIYGVVMGLRNNRPNMVQTEDQYIFIHDCIKDFISSDEENDAQDGGEEPTYQNV